MKREKGFTLIELLVVIVILAIIMVIAVPRILEVINSSKASSWKNSTKLVKKSIELNTSTPDPQTSEYKYTVQDLCSNTSKISEIVDIGDIDVTCNPSNSDYVFDLKGKGQFSGRESTITCNTTGNCSSNIVSNDGDSSSSSLSWSELVGNSTEGFSKFFVPEKEYEPSNGKSTLPENSSFWGQMKSPDFSETQVCSILPGGTVCLDPSSSSRKSELVKSGSDEVITGYSATKKAEFESKGATCSLVCDKPGCNMKCQNNQNNDSICKIKYNGNVECGIVGVSACSTGYDTRIDGYVIDCELSRIYR